MEIIQEKRFGKITSKALRYVKYFCFGALSACLLMPITKGAYFLAHKIGFIQEATRSDNIRGTIAKLKAQGYVNFDAESLINASQYMAEYVRQLNTHFESAFHQTVFSMKATLILQMVIYAPLLEEFIFRYLIQDLLFNRFPKKITMMSAPGKEACLNFTGVRETRIIVTASLFSAYHLINLVWAADSYVTLQLITTFILGISFGVLKESRVGLLGAISAHMTYNYLALFFIIWGG